MVYCHKFFFFLSFLPIFKFRKGKFLIGAQTMTYHALLGRGSSKRILLKKKRSNDKPPKEKKIWGKMERPIFSHKNGQKRVQTKKGPLAPRIWRLGVSRFGVFGRSSLFPFVKICIRLGLMVLGLLPPLPLSRTLIYCRPPTKNGGFPKVKFFFLKNYSFWDYGSLRPPLVHPPPHPFPSSSNTLKKREVFPESNSS